MYKVPYDILTEGVDCSFHLVCLFGLPSAFAEALFTRAPYSGATYFSRGKIASVYLPAAARFALLLTVRR